MSKIFPAFILLLLISMLVLGACSQPSTSVTASSSTPANTAPVITSPSTPSPSPASPGAVTLTISTPPSTSTALATTTSPAAATTLPMPRGTKDPDIIVDVYDASLAYAGTTLMPDNHNLERPRIIEVNMLGEIVWQYVLPDDVKRYTNPGFDVELLSNNNVLFLLPGKGIYEIDRTGKVVWSFIDAKVSHDADRLPNGNTLFAFGNNDQMSDPQVREIDPSGKVVWSWYARDYFNKPPYSTISLEGWSHTNAVSRLDNGNTLISPRNFNQLVEVSPDGKVVKTYGEGIFDNQHDPMVLPNGVILLANHGKPHLAIEYDPQAGRIIWRSPPFELSEIPVRDANRLPNGNTLITSATKIIEVTRDNKVVWQLKLNGITFNGQEAAGRGFYKAERIPAK